MCTCRSNTAAPDYYGGHRPGDNLFAESLVCLDAETGKRVWHYQFVHHGLWDYDPPAAPNLLDITVNSRRSSAVAQVTKQGFVFTFDRVTGEPVWPIEERPTPPSDVPGEHTAATQPFPTRPAPFEYQGVTIDDLADFTPEIRRMAVAAIRNFKNRSAVYAAVAVRPGRKPGDARTSERRRRRQLVGCGRRPRHRRALRAIEKLHVDLPARGAAPRAERHAAVSRAAWWLNAEDAGVPAAVQAPVLAVDRDQHEHRRARLDVPLRRRQRHPAPSDAEGSQLPPVGGDSTTSGPLLTKTLIVHAITTGGTNDGPRLVARDKATGRNIASVDLPGLAIGTPMTYMIDNKAFGKFLYIIL